MYSFYLNFALPRPTRRAQVQSKKITTLEKRQFIHVLKGLKQRLKVQESPSVRCKLNLELFQG